MDYQFIDKKGKHRYDSLLNAREAAEASCIETKKDVMLQECQSGKVKCIFTYTENPDGTGKAKISLP